jgi:hypothetical protein
MPAQAYTQYVMPAQAGISLCFDDVAEIPAFAGMTGKEGVWIPAFAGMTGRKGCGFLPPQE